MGKLAFSVPYSFSVFCCYRTGVSRYKHCSRGSQVPARLKGKEGVRVLGVGEHLQTGRQGGIEDESFCLGS